GRAEEGKVEIGYSVLPEFQRRGFATEMVAALTDWALAEPRVRAVFADVDPENTPSVRLLTKLGYVQVGEGDEPGYVRVERVK
ncbi:MAG TPA: GNAT family N-acetyltransferase, partial [Byssovorax sp.]